MGGHRHVALMGGEDKACQAYPDKLCRAMLKGIKSELVHSGKLKGKDSDMLIASGNDEEYDDQHDQYVDDISGRPLLTDLVVQAREAEVQNFRNHNVCAKVPISECIRLTGKQPIGSKWIDISKGNAKTPND